MNAKFCEQSPIISSQIKIIASEIDKKGLQEKL